jgi:hypothetical protein
LGQLNTFLARSGRGGSGRPQFASGHPHPIAERAWYTFAVTVGGGSMAHFVNGVEEMRDTCGTDDEGEPMPCETPLPYFPHAHGRMSIGVRINQVWPRTLEPLWRRPVYFIRDSPYKNTQGGVRMTPTPAPDQVCWFKGVVAAVRFTPRVLPAAELLRPPSRAAAPPPPAAAPTLFERFEVPVYVACGILLAAAVFFAARKAHAVRHHDARCPAGRGCSAAG